MTLNLLQILVVEDNPDFMTAAAMHFTNPDVNAIPIFANCFDEAEYKLQNQKFNGVITDCFFPRNSSNDTSLGKQVIEKMLATDETAQRVERYTEVLSQFIDLADPELRTYVRSMASESEESDPMKNPVVRAIKQVNMLGKEVASHIAKNTLGMVCKSRPYEFRDHYEALAQAMQKDPANQALGILVAEKAEELGIPKILATSTHHHDALTQPIQNYCGKRNWALVDCSQNNPNEKATPEFWKRAYEELLIEMKEKM
jgi:hypothetical protein